MSIVASFVSECARNGRWVRGLLALQGNIHSDDVDVSRARIQLATAMINNKEWNAALAMVKSSDIFYIDELCHFIYECTRSNSVPSEASVNLIKTFLQTGRVKKEIQNQIFFSAIKWTTWNHALQFFAMLESPDRKSIKEICKWLEFSRMFGSNEKRNIITAILLRLNASETDVLDWTTRVKLNPKRVIPFSPTLAQEQSELFQALDSLKSEEPLSMMSVVKIANAAMCGKYVSWKLALSLISKHQVVGDCDEMFSKMIGICCPQNWRVALDHFHLGGKNALWLASRQSWIAGLMMSQSALIKSREAYDILSRCAIPTSQLRKLITVSGATKRLHDPSKRSIASMLACGYVLEELQLSAFSKMCHRTGDWESALILFDRVGTDEFQRRAISSVLESCPHVKLEMMLKIVNDRHPASASTTSMMIKHFHNWVQALAILRHVMACGTRCNPQILSALMDVRPPLNVLSMVIRKQEHATNEGIMRRLKFLEEEDKKKDALAR